MGRFDLFYNAADRSSFTQVSTSGTTSGAVDLVAEGSDFTLASAPSAPFTLGQRVLIVSSAFHYCVVSKVTDSTHIRLTPIQSAADTAGLPHNVANGSLLFSFNESAARSVIDLSEAPGDAYDYLILACGVIESSAAPGEVEPFLRINALQDDPISGTGAVGDCRASLSAANPDRMNFVAASKLNLVGGQRYEHSIDIASLTAGATATIANPRILALRYLDGNFAGDGKTAEQTTTDKVNYQDHLDLGANLPAGDYLIVGTWAATNSSTSQRADVVLEATAGGTVLANQVAKPTGSLDYIPAGFCGIVTLGATNRVRIRFRATGSTAKIKNAFLAAIPLASLPAIAGTHVSQDLATNASQVVTDNNFVTMKTSDSVDLEAGRHIEIVSVSVGGSAPIRSRPNFGAGGTGLGGHNVVFGTDAGDYNPTFWFLRNNRDAGATTNSVEMRRNTGVSTTLKARDFTFSWLREQADFVPQPDEKVAVVADVEMGGRVYKHWNSTTTTRRYSHRISDFDMLSRVRVSPPAGSPPLTEYVRVYSLGALTDGCWYWDALAHDLYVQLTTSHAAIGSPDSEALHVVVVPLLLAGLGEKYDLVDSLGTRWPYRPLLESVPTKTQTLRSTNARFSTASSLGQLQIAMAHGEFDDKLFRSSYESYRARVRRGFPRQSNRLEDFEVIADATIRRPQSDFKTLTLRLLDRRRLLQTPVANTRVTVREGYDVDARERENQELPVVWGETLGLVAYRLTANEGGTDNNEYQFCDHAVSSVTNVWIDTERRKAVGAGHKNVTATYIGVGKVLVNNAAFDEPTQPPDVVYVDLGAGRTVDGTVTGRALHTYGEIARDLIVTYGGTASTRLLERTLRMVDRRWRWQQKASGAGRRPVAPRLSLVVSGKTSIEEALTQLSGDNHALWIVNHQDRVGVDVPDFDRGLMTRNHGFEDDTVYPWTTANGATISLTTARKYEGAQSAEISNGSPTNANAYVAQSILLAAGGLHAVTLPASLLEGEPSAFRISVVGPSGVETLSEPFTLRTGQWARASLVYESVTGDTGFTELRIYPAYGSTTATRVAIDNVEVYRVAVVTDRVHSEPQSIDWEDEHYYECAVPHSVNRQAAGNQLAKRVVGQSEARGLSAALEPEGKYAIQSSSRAELTEARAADGDSAGGIAAAVALQYSRERPVLEIDVFGLDRLPVVGDYAFHRDNPRIPESTDEYPIWRISSVTFEDAKRIRLKLRRQRDPVVDRIDISPDNIPMGAGAFTISAGAITDYSEVTAAQGQFLMAADAPDLSTQRGNLFHKHSLSHVHPVPSHQHVATPSSHGIDSAGAAGVAWDVNHDGKYDYPAPAGPQEQVRSTRGATDGGHAHPVPGTPANVGASAGTSSTPNATLETSPGPVEPSFRRVRLMARVANTQDTIDANLIVGFRTASLPAGWLRCDGAGGRPNLDDVYLRCATVNGAVSTTVATSTFTPSDSGSTLNVASGTGISVGKRLRIRRTDDGNKQVHVVVTAGSGTAWTVIPLHETTDEANSYTFPAGANSTVAGDSEAVNTAYAAPTHKHGGTMPSHQHAAGGHTHPAAQFLLGFADQGLDAQKLLGGGPPGVTASADEHTHLVNVVPPAANDNSGSAAGTLTGDVAPTPGFFELVWAVSDGNQRTIPAGGVLPWTQSADAPGGWAKIGEAVGLLLKGAAASQGPSDGVGGHVHTQSNSAHTMAHAHGGTIIGPSEEPSGSTIIAENSTAATISVAAGPGSATEKGHAHALTSSLSSVDPGLSANAHATGAALTELPLHKQIVLIEKL